MNAFAALISLKIIQLESLTVVNEGYSASMVSLAFIMMWLLIYCRAKFTQQSSRRLRCYLLLGEIIPQKITNISILTDNM